MHPMSWGQSEDVAFWLLGWSNRHLIVRLCYSPLGGCNNLLNAMHCRLGLAYALFFRSWLCQLRALPSKQAQKHQLLRSRGTPRTTTCIFRPAEAMEWVAAGYGR